MREKERDSREADGTLLTIAAMLPPMGAFVSRPVDRFGHLKAPEITRSGTPNYWEEPRERERGSQNRPAMSGVEWPLWSNSREFEEESHEPRVLNFPRYYCRSLAGGRRPAEITNPGMS